MELNTILLKDEEIIKCILNNFILTFNMNMNVSDITCLHFNVKASITVHCMYVCLRGNVRYSKCTLCAKYILIKIIFVAYCLIGS